MSERDSGKESAEFWQGHHFKDYCPWDNNPGGGVSPRIVLQIPRVLREMYSYPFRDRRYFDEIRAFMAMKPDAPIKTLRDGQEFKISDYPRGTIIKISKDEKFRAGGVYSYRMWGFIEQERDPDNQHSDLIIAFPEHFFNSGVGLFPGNSAFRNWHDAFVIGEVIHDRERTMFLPYQTLTKYGEVEIWKFGQAVRERVPEKAPGSALETKRI